MRYLKLFESLEEYKIHEKCKYYNIKDYTINKDGSIDVYSEVDLYDKKLKKLPLKFNKINGDFNCRFNSLISLEGSPVEINGSFFCSDNKLTSFRYSPKIIRRSFVCTNNKIKTFEYFPSYVGGQFWCSNPIFEVWWLFQDTTKIELLNDFDIFRDEDADEPVIIMDRLNDFLLTIGHEPVKNVFGYKNI